MSGVLRLIERALSIDLQFLQEHPECLFQQLYNWLRWESSETIYYSDQFEQLLATQTLLASWRDNYKPLTLQRAVIEALWPPLDSLVTIDSALTLESWGASLAWKPDSRLLAIGLSNGGIELWDTANGKRQRLTGHSAKVTQLAWSSTGNLASGTNTGELRHWSGTGAGTFEEAGRPLKFPASICLVLWRPGRQRLLIVLEDGTLAFTEGESTTEVLEVAGSRVDAAVYLPEESRLVLGGRGGAITSFLIRDSADGAEVTDSRKIGAHEQVRALASFSRSGRSTVVSVGEDCRLRYWDPSTGKTIHTESHDGGLLCLAVRPGTDQVAYAGDLGAVHIKCQTDSKATRQLEGHGKWVRALGWSSDGVVLASTDYEATVRTWTPEQPRERTKVTPRHRDTVTGLDWSPDGAKLVSVGYDGVLNLWDPKTAEKTYEKNCESDWLLAVGWSPAPSQVVCGSIHGTLHHFDLVRNRVIGPLPSGSSRVDALAWHPDSGFFALGSMDGSVIFSVKDIPDLPIINRKVTSLAWHPAGELLAVGTNDPVIEVWNPAKSDQVFLLVGHTDWIKTLSWSPEGTMLASGSDDGRLHVWSWPPPEPGVSFDVRAVELNSRIHAIAWHPRWPVLATGSADGRIRIWNARTLSLLAALPTYVSISALSWSKTELLAAASERGMISLYKYSPARDRPVTPQPLPRPLPAPAG